ncbi:hypothetical protein FOZ62_005211 [Perkinsus olseni]|uniref:Uncharacterized protein n=1 Tax=Perkinsus olseni TaxID=32597 RepID=A0A7J6U843_PEROL|nr:hypothetical protein FOZ62_005211 [Perkinsus olseni]
MFSAVLLVGIFGITAAYGKMIESGYGKFVIWMPAFPSIESFRFIQVPDGPKTWMVPPRVPIASLPFTMPDHSVVQSTPLPGLVAGHAYSTLSPTVNNLSSADAQPPEDPNQHSIVRLCLL